MKKLIKKWLQLMTENDTYCITGQFPTWVYQEYYRMKK